MIPKGFDAYKQQSVNTMTQGELLVLLYDELVKRLMRAEIALKAKNFELFEDSAIRCKEIIQYLDDTLDKEQPISQELHRLYEYFSYSLVRVQMGRNMEVLQEIKPMIMDLRDTFHTAQQTGGV